MADPTRFDKLRSSYKKAEDLLHTLGVNTQIDTSAVNELRYAGRHILDALVATDRAEEHKQLTRAEAHCERAVYDAYDGAIFFHLRNFRTFLNDYKNVVIAEVIPDFVETMRRMEEAEQFLATARSAGDDRSQYYGKAEETYRWVANATKTLTAARPELNKLIAAYNEGIERARESASTTEVAKAQAAQAEANAVRGRRHTMIVAGVTALINAIVYALIRLFSG